MQKQLQQLIDLLPEANVIGGANKTITDITADSSFQSGGSRSGGCAGGRCPLRDS